MILGLLYAGRRHGTWRVSQTFDSRWPEIELLITHRVTNARSESANTRHQADQTHRSGTSRTCSLSSRILLISAAPRAACAH
jgi:hypothetical protein